MNANKALAAELMAALGIATIGAGKFPPPHRYTGIMILFFVLGIIANFGLGVARVAAALGGLVVLTIAMGQAGIRTFSWLGGVGSRLGTDSASSSPPPGPAGLGGNIIGAAERITRPRRR